MRHFNLKFSNARKFELPISEPQRVKENACIKWLVCSSRAQRVRRNTGLNLKVLSDLKPPSVKAKQTIYTSNEK